MDLLMNYRIYVRVFMPRKKFGTGTASMMTWCK